MRTQIQMTLLISISSLLLVQQTQGQPRGDLIGGTPVVGTNTAASASSQNTNTTDVASIGFDLLSGYIIALTDELESNTNRTAWADKQINDMIPPVIKAFDGKKVVLEGFMLPTDYDTHGKVVQFIVMKNQMSCCYGGPTQIHEFASVKVHGPGVNSVMDVPVRVKGVLHVGPHRENGRLTDVYRMEAESVTEASAF
jgi:hypothetical protein